MPGLLQIPEVVGLDWRRSLVRIPADLDVPLTDRVRRLIDTPEFQRLKRISQLGLVANVYPAAHHTRFEHSLGVYRLALLLLKQLAHDERFDASVGPRDAELFIVTALLHDLGHWPFCHPLEDLQLIDVANHEWNARLFLSTGELTDLLRRDWRIEPSQVLSLLNKEAPDRVTRLLSSMLSGPIDIDKMDYLYRDSLHAGVPYGRNFDQNRLLGSLCLNQAGDGLAINNKGKTATELMVFARYVMFSEVYWHHAVRAATAMLQRAFYLLHARMDIESLMMLGDAAWIDAMRAAAENGPAATLLEGLFGPRRSIYKRVAEYTITEHPDIYRGLAGRPYPWLQRCGHHFADLASQHVGCSIAVDEVLIDAPPQQREVEFKVDIFHAKEGRYRPLAQVSPVVRALAEEQFDDYVKRVRVFAHPAVAPHLRPLDKKAALLEKAICATS